MLLLLEVDLFLFFSLDGLVFNLKEGGSITVLFLQLDLCDLVGDLELKLFSGFFPFDFTYFLVFNFLF